MSLTQQDVNRCQCQDGEELISELIDKVNFYSWLCIVACFFGFILGWCVAVTRSV